MTKNIPGLSVSLHELTPFRPAFYGIEKGKPERSGEEPVPKPREGKYMKKLKLKLFQTTL